MRFTRFMRAGGVALASVLLAGGLVAQSASSASANGFDGHGHGHGHPSHGANGALIVAAGGTSTNSGRSCNSAQYPTIQSAVNAATAGATVIVCPGTYNEDVVIPTALSLHGLNATIDAVPTNATMCDQLGQMGPGSAPCLAGVTIKSSNVEIDGFTVENAIGEGILATGSLAGGSISNVTITNNHVTGNDTGGIPVTTTSPYPQCNGFGQDPGDCGEGIHLMGVGNSVVSGNEVNGNSGGVLLTDEFGPTHDNVVEGNVVTENQSDCGITVPGHNPNALDAAGNPQPTVAGVYNNVIRGNVVTNNGLLGEGAGVLFANATAGTASYNNLVEGNYIAGNGLSGVTMHAHTLAPGQFEDLNGNQIIGNVIGTNNSAGDELDGPPAQDLVTTGVLVFSASVSTSVTIAHNLIFGNQNGVWLGINGHVSATIVHNLFLHNAVPVFTYS